MDSTESRFSRRDLLQGIGTVLGSSVFGARAMGAGSSGNDDSLNEGDPWARARAQLVLNPRLAYFDTAQFAPSSRAVLASEYRAQEALHTDPLGFYAERYAATAVQSSCLRLSNWLACTPDELCFTRGAAAGMSQCAQALTLQAGDEVLINAQLPDAQRRLWMQQARQRGLILKTITLPIPLHSSTEVLAAFENALSERSRVLVCSHVQPLDGAVLPIRELCQLARARGLISVIDGTFSMGAVQLSMRDLGCDVYSASLCHWLNGPQQTGVLYVRAELQPTLLTDETTSNSDFTLTGSRLGWPKLLQRWPNDFIALAPQLQSLSAALAWQEGVGRARIEARLRELQTYTRLNVQNIAEVEPLTPVQPGMWLQLLSLRTGKHNAFELANWLRNNDRVIVSGFNTPQDGLNVLRVSLHIYNSHDEIDRLSHGLQRALRA